MCRIYRTWCPVRNIDIYTFSIDVIYFVKHFLQFLQLDNEGGKMARVFFSFLLLLVFYSSKCSEINLRWLAVIKMFKHKNWRSLTGASRHRNVQSLELSGTCWKFHPHLTRSKSFRDVTRFLCSTKLRSWDGKFL